MLACVVASIEPLRGAEEPSAFERQKNEALRANRLPETFRQAKNVILFVGDGMGVSTITAARILDGQNKGQTGEENVLFFERFPYTALSKTYSINMQTPDSAATMTAMVTGHKTKTGVLSYDSSIVRDDYRSTVDGGGESIPVRTLLEQFELAGKASGVVTTTTLTHATPGACYAHSPSRNWVNGDYTGSSKAGNPEYEEAIKNGFKDIARQFVEFPFGDGVDVALAGGHRDFLPKPAEEESESDPKPAGPDTGSSPADENADGPPTTGNRIDGRNLVAEWSAKEGRQVVWDRQALLDVSLPETRQLLGFFGSGNLAFEADLVDDDERSVPRLSEMASTAFKMLRRNKKGFFLMVEGGRIDHAHHASNAKRALMETVEFDAAVRAVYGAMTEQERAETLIVVTADHSHVFVLAGYAKRGNPILGKVAVNKSDAEGEPTPEFVSDALGLPYTTLGYYNGAGFRGMMMNTKTFEHAHGPKPLSKNWKFINIPRSARPDLTHIDTEHINFLQESAVPLSSETHGGEDVAIFATGPGSHMFRGSREQNYIYHAIRLALGMNE